MSDSQNKILLNNTLFLYVRTLLLLVLGLYTSRVTMQALGVENYGIINVVGGFVSMFALLSGSLTSACQRFITFELGKDGGNVRHVFSSTFYIHLALAFIVAIILETIGLYFVNSKLNLPADKMVEVQWVFHCSVVSFILNLINIPYISLIVAYERMKAFAYISIIEAALKFATVYSILILPFNSLIIYSCLTLVSTTIIRFIYQIYCIRSFSLDAKLERVKDRKELKIIFRFAGWSFLGNASSILNSQGVNILLNIFGNVSINAARGIASMIEGVIVGFVNNFTTALNPQITKAYAKSDNLRLNSLLNIGIRLSFFLMIIMVIPFNIAMRNIFKLWLVTYPDYAVVFARITLLTATIQAIANPFMTAINATGKIKVYQIVVGCLALSNVPISYILLKVGCSSIVVYITSLVIAVVTYIVRLYFVHRNVRISISCYYKLIVFNLFPIAMISSSFSLLLSKNIDLNNLLQLVFFVVLSCLFTMLIIYYLGLNKGERTYFYVIVRRVTHYINKK